MNVSLLWNKNCERIFFKENIKENIDNIKKLFYRRNENNFYAYWPKDYQGERSNEVLQARNTFVREFTEEWSSRLFEGIAQEMGAYAV